MSADSGDYDYPLAPPLTDGDGHRYGPRTAAEDDGRHAPVEGMPTSELPATRPDSPPPESAVPLWVTQPLATQLPDSFEPPASPPRSGPVAPGGTRSATAPLSGPDVDAYSAVPTGPPPRHRPGSVSVGGPSPFLSEPAPAYQHHPTTRHEAVSQRQEAPGSGAGAWGWRALIAFVAGGLLTASGFAVAQLSDGGSQLAASDTTADTSVQDVASSIEPTTTVPPETTTSSTAPPTDGAVEPAVAVAALLGPSVVQLETNFGIGSGVIYGDGLILTNAHVVEDASSLSVQLSDGRHLTGEVVGTEPNVDIAVVSVGAGQELPIATLATGEVVQVGQTAIAIGSPFSLQQSVTEGIVSAVGRPVLHGTSVTAMIQTDAPINPGNSGGALADLNGRVIGINTAIQTDGTSGSNAGVGFAIPIDTAISVADRLVAGIPIEPGFLGIRGGESTDGSAGVEVTEVTSGSAAETAGLVVGDRILSIDGAPVSQFQELAGLVVARSPGDVVELEVIRNGEPVTIAVTLGTRPEDG